MALFKRNVISFDTQIIKNHKKYIFENFFSRCYEKGDSFVGVFCKHSAYSKKYHENRQQTYKNQLNCSSGPGLTCNNKCFRLRRGQKADPMF